jgi:murein DD-endopeptidase MepM/ murein hydrolase activator NlpD
MKKFLSLSIALSLITTVFAQKISIVSKPEKILIEQGETKQSLNFDFLVTNTSLDTLSLSKLMVSVLDDQGKVIHTRFLDNNGVAPSIRMIPNGKFEGTSAQLIFNPFTDFSLTLPLSKLVYEWTFVDNAENEFKFNLVVVAQKYQQKENFKFPLKGKILVYDAHDLYAHHRRFDYEFAPIKALGITSNFMRYAYDFVILDANNKQSSNEGKTDADYFSLGKSVYAIGAGKVIYASNAHKDDKTFDIPGIAKNPLELYGNCIAIQHSDNSISIYGHLKQNSLKVNVGDVVKMQQEIGAVGVSGSSFFPHLHFEIRTSIQNSAEGVPSYFSDVYLTEGAVKTKLKSGLVETGQILETE